MFLPPAGMRVPDLRCIVRHKAPNHCAAFIVRRKPEPRDLCIGDEGAFLGSACFT